MAKVKFTYRVPRGLLSPESRPQDLDRIIDPPVTAPQPLPKQAPATRVDVPLDDGDLDQRLIDRWWHESSFDLRCGLDVVEDTTVPGELMDDLFGQYKAKSPRGR